MENTIENTRHKCSETFTDFNDARARLIDGFTFRQYKLWNKEFRRVREALRASNDTFHFNAMIITKVTLGLKAIERFNKLCELYDEYLIYEKRAEFRLVA